MRQTYDQTLARTPTGRFGEYLDGSLANRIRQFFLGNPTEELTYADIAVKFDCTQTTARNVVSELRKRGLLESIHVVRMAQGKGLSA